MLVLAIEGLGAEELGYKLGFLKFLSLWTLFPFEFLTLCLGSKTAIEVVSLGISRRNQSTLQNLLTSDCQEKEQKCIFFFLHFLYIFLIPTNLFAKN